MAQTVQAEQLKNIAFAILFHFINPHTRNKLKIETTVTIDIQGVDKKSAHPQKHSQFGITVTGRTEINKNRVFLECFLGDLFKKLLTYLF